MKDITVYTQKLSITINHLLSNFTNWFKKTFFHPSDAMMTFYLLFIVSICCFIVTWATHYMTIPLGGDYTLQEMTFLFNGYDDWHHFFETGEFVFWDRSVFLGIDNIGGNSFYYLFDPFFLIMLLFPRDWLLVLQGISFAPKMIIAGMFFYWYLGEFNISNKNRRIGALVYGFCGYSFQYLWFHFLSSVAFLPLIFLGVERVIKRRDPRILLIGFLLNGMASYFFFVVFIIGAFFYAIYRFFQTYKSRSLDENWAVLGMGVFSFLIGIFLTAFTLLPGMITAMNMPRTSDNTWLNNILNADSFSELLNAIFTFPSNTEHNQITPLLNFLFMPEGCYYSNLLNVSWYDNMAASLYATIPMLLIFFTGLFEAFKSKRYSYIIGTFFMAFLIFTPIGFYLFSGFTVGYARYFIVPLFFMITFDMITIERRREINRNLFDLAFVSVLVLYIVASVLVIYGVNENPNNFPSSTYWDLRMIEIPISAIYLLLSYLLMRRLFHKSKFSKTVFALSAIDVIVMANVTIIFQGTANIDTMAGGPNNIAMETQIVELLNESDDDYFRIFNPTADRDNINISLREGYVGLGAFHSVYPFNVQDFLDRSRIPYTYHNWSMGIHNRRENLETFLGTKYYLVPKVSLDYGPNEIPFHDYDIPYGYKNILDLTSSDLDELGVTYSDELLEYLASDECTKSLYVNMNFVDTAFAFDSIINTRFLETGSYSDGSPYYGRYEDVNEYPLLRFAMLDDEDYKDLYSTTTDYKFGTYTINGMEYTIEDDASASSKFYSSLVSNHYLKDGGKPIEYWTGSSRLKIDVYSANWPATENNPDGEYAFMNPEDPYDKTGEDEYKEANPFLYANGIGKADTKYDYYSLTDDEGNSSADYSRSVLYNSKLVITPYYNNESTTVCTEADPNDPTSGCYISINDTNNIEWRFFDEDNKLISIGRHSYSSYKQAHGYYVDRPVKTIVGIVNEGTKDSPCNLDTPEIYVIRNSDYQEAIDKLKENEAVIIKRNDNSVTFSTDYETDKFVVLNYPLQDGWNLYRYSEDDEGNIIKEEVQQYKAQGGFIGFVGEKGKQYYLLEYTSPYFNIAAIITIIGLFATLLSLISFTKIDHSRKLKEEYLNSLRHETNLNIKKIKQAYDDCEDNE